MLVFRLGSARFPANDGIGASLFGGRWNHKGTPIVYAADSRALCALEVLSNAGELAGDYAVTLIDIPSDLPVPIRSIEDLPSSWMAPEPSDATRDIGTAWANGLTSAVLAVPSVVIPQSYNYLLNPRHPEFSRLGFVGAEPFSFDARLRRAWVKR